MSSNHKTRVSSFFRAGVFLSVCALALPLCFGWARMLTEPDAPTVSPAPVTAATQEEQFTGQWTLETKANTEKVWFSLYRQGERGSFSQSSSDFPLDKFRGLTREQLMAGGENVSFKLVRDAGTLDCRGWFKDGKGSGHFTFIASQSFVSEMLKLGYQRLSSEQLFALAMHDVSLGYIEELKALGYDNLSLDDLIAMKIHGVTTKYIVELRARGYDQLSSEQLVAMRIHGVTIEFIEDLAAHGYKRLSSDDLVAMRIHGVTTDVIREMQALGYESPSAEELVAMRIHGVTPEFVKELGALGYKSVPADELVAMRIHGVTIAFIEKMKARGVKDLSIEELLRMKIHGFDN